MPRKSRELSEIEILAFDFFILYSKFDYWLKSSQCFKSKNDGTPAEPIQADWDKFASRYQNDLSKMRSEISGFDLSKDYIINNQPKKEVLNNSQILEFQDDGFTFSEFVNASEPEKTRKIELEKFKRLFCLISRIRNNLFHGSKFNSSEIVRGRNTCLLLLGTFILETVESKLDLFNMLSLDDLKA